MGNSTSQDFQITQPLPQQWSIDRVQSYCTILKHSTTHEQMQQYVLTCTTSPQQQINLYEYRFHQKYNLVKVISVQKQNIIGFCSSTTKLTVTTQRISKRLSQLKNLIYEQSLNILYLALIGYKAIYNEVGYVQINDEMIGFNHKNQCKVWLNENFSKNQPQNQYEDYKSDDRIYEMIMRLINVISQHSSLRLDEYQNYVKLLLASKPSFDLAISKLEEFIKITHTRLPSLLTLQENKNKNEIKKVIVPPPQYQKPMKSPTDICVATSDVFQINPQQPNIQKKYNKSVDALSKVIRYQTPQKYLIHQNQNHILNHVKSQSKFTHNLPAHKIMVSPQNRPNLIPKSFINQNKIYINSSMKSPQSHHSKFNSNHINRSVQKQSRLHQIFKSKQKQNEERDVRTPVAKLSNIKSNSSIKLVSSSRIQSPNVKIMNSNYNSKSISKFNPNYSSKPSKFCPDFQSSKINSKHSEDNDCFQVTGQFPKFQKKQQNLFEQVSSQSNRMNSFVPGICLSSNDDERIDIQEIVANIKSDLDDVQISKNTIVLVDKSHSNQHLPSSRITDNLKIIQQIKSSKQNSFRQTDFQTYYEQSNLRIARQNAAVSFGGNEKGKGQQNVWLSISNFKQYAPCGSIHYQPINISPQNHIIHQHEIKRIPRGAQIFKAGDIKPNKQQPRNNFYL